MTRDVTKELLEKASGPGKNIELVKTTKGTKKLTPTLAAFLDEWRRSGKNTIGYVSNALAYSGALSRRGTSYHRNMIRLIKGGHLRVCEVNEPPPAGTSAKIDSPYGDRFYVLTEAGSCPIKFQSYELKGSRRRKQKR